MGEQVDLCIAPLAIAGRVRGARPTQQDELICLHAPDADARLLVLADGMGGDGAGELAARAVIEVARRVWEQGSWREQPGSLFLEALLQEAHRELRRLRDTLPSGEPHSTAVALLIKGERACWAHVGDSRLYRFQGQRCLEQTRDHSVAQLKRQRGEYSTAEQHKLLRGLGGEHAPVVDHGLAMLRPGQAFVLCSDGVWEHLSTAELAALSRARDPQAALEQALALVVRRGGEHADNASLVVARVADTGWIRRLLARMRSVRRDDVTA
jgi:serine/threonine protein phosphatase PrpC